MEWGQPTNGSAARRHSSQSHGFAVRLWSNLCICSPAVVELVRTNLVPDFPLFHDLLSLFTPCHYLSGAEAGSVHGPRRGPRHEGSRGELQPVRDVLRDCGLPEDGHEPGLQHQPHRGGGHRQVRVQTRHEVEREVRRVPAVPGRVPQF